MAIKEIVNFVPVSYHNYTLMKQHKLILIGSISILLFIIAAGVAAYFWIIDKYGLNGSGADLVNTAVQLKNLDEKELAKYNPASQRAVDVLAYNLKINLYPEEKKIAGDELIILKVNDKKLPSIEINFYDNMKIKKLLLNGEEVKYSRSEKVLKITRQDLNADSARVNIIYEGTPVSAGLGSFNFIKINNRYQVYTLSEPVFASTWFPCVDLPDDKALAEIWITNDTSKVSMSNGKLIDVKTSGGRRTYHWKTFYPISTYLIALYSGDYKTFADKYVTAGKDTLSLSYYVLPDKLEDAKKDFSDHKKYLKTFEELFGEYPFVKEKYSVAEFWWNAGAMEHQTITGIGSDYISGKKFFSDMLIHELAHHWWGDAVGLKSWKDIWLNEGFATYSEALYWEKQSDIRALQSTMSSKFGSFLKGKLYNPGDALFGSLVYNKGAWVLHMLRREVGDENFFAILRQYFKQYKYGNASTADFKSVCEKISEKNLSYFFNQWVYNGEGIIEAEAGWSVKNADKKFLTTITIKQLQNGYDIYKFPLDIKLFSQKSGQSIVSKVRIEGKEVVLNLESEFKPDGVQIDPDGWLLAKFNVNEENIK